MRSPNNTSKTCSRCGDKTKSNRVERGLYVYSSCELVANGDCNGAENMRQKKLRVLGVKREHIDSETADE